MTRDIFDVIDNVCLITGASSGLGVIMAEGLAEAGARVVLAARRLDKLREVSDALKSKGYRAEAVKCDVTNEMEVRSTIESVIRNYGSLDMLVNNAGTTAVSPTAELQVEDWKQVLDANLTGVFLCCKSVLRQMMAQKRGKVVNISSVYGLMADISPELPYYTSKAGIVGLTRQLALELASHNVQVNAIAPGFFPSEMTEPIIMNVDSLAYTLSRIPMKRIGTPQELKGVIRFLGSRASDYITGQVIVVDGGWSLW
ncbi:MAG TPA: SDR family NAD(P)-dependent oxidoreductase [Candidatus Acidoferrum sp.]|nr:SDR family NAD(P)-dependent oxidoreductase [Candidatus Acidoferrum sp.]